MERSQPIKNNKVRNLTLMEMRKEKTRSLGTSVQGGKKERMKSEGLKNRLWVCVCVLCLSGSMLVWMPAYVCRRSGACVRAFMCVRQTGSCTGARLFLNIVRTSIDNKQVRAGEEREEKKEKGWIQRRDISLCPHFTKRRQRDMMNQ